MVWSNYSKSCTRMLRAILNKSWRQHPTKHQLYGHLPSISKTIQVRWTRQTGHCLRSRDKLISDVLLWTPTYGRAKAGQPARTYIHTAHVALKTCQRRWTIGRSAGGTTWWWWWFQVLVIHFYLKIPENSVSHLPGQVLVCASIICLYSQIL